MIRTISGRRRTVLPRPGRDSSAAPLPSRRTTRAAADRREQRALVIHGADRDGADVGAARRERRRGDARVLGRHVDVGVAGVEADRRARRPVEEAVLGESRDEPGRAARVVVGEEAGREHVARPRRQRRDDRVAAVGAVEERRELARVRLANHRVERHRVGPRVGVRDPRDVEAREARLALERGGKLDASEIDRTGHRRGRAHLQARVRLGFERALRGERRVAALREAGEEERVGPGEARRGDDVATRAQQVDDGARDAGRVIVRMGLGRRPESDVVGRDERSP